MKAKQTVVRRHHADRVGAAVKRLIALAVALIPILAAMPAAAQQIKTGWGEWHYLKVTTALEVTEYLVLYGETESGTSWIITRDCNGVPVLQSKVNHQGEAVDIGRAYYKRPTVGRTTGRVYQCYVGMGPGLCSGWHYETRWRVDDLPIRKRTWMYGWDSDGGWEQLYLKEGYYSSSEFEGVRPEHSIDELFIGDRLVIEISPSKGVAVFNTTGFAEALAEYCAGRKPYVYED